MFKILYLKKTLGSQKEHILIARTDLQAASHSKPVRIELKTCISEVIQLFEMQLAYFAVQRRFNFIEFCPTSSGDRTAMWARRWLAKPLAEMLSSSRWASPFTKVRELVNLMSCLHLFTKVGFVLGDFQHHFKVSIGDSLEMQ